MSEELADMRRQLTRMTSHMQRLESASRQTWALAPTGGSAAKTQLYRIVAGNAIGYLGSQGIVKRIDTVAGSELPVGVGTGVVAVPPNPAAVGLPNGIGVAQAIDSSAYIWVLLDSNMGSACPDLTTNDIIIPKLTVTLARTSGANTFNYVCTVPVSGWW